MEPAKRFSTKHLPEAEKLSRWREFFTSTIVPVEIEAQWDAPFDAEATLLTWPQLRALWCNTSAQMSVRTSGSRTDGYEPLGFIVNQGGRVAVSQHGTDVALSEGEAVAVLCAEPGKMAVSHGEFFCLIASRRRLARLVGEVEHAVMRTIRCDNEPLRLLIGYVRSLREASEFCSPEVRHLVATHVHELIGLALGADCCAGCGIRAERLSALKSDILENIGNPELTVHAVARRQHVTPRYVHMLFRSEGCTFSEYVLAARLKNAHRMLSDPRCARKSISTIAFEAGFGDLSYFDRRFRRHFGATPSEVRQSVRADNQ